MLKTVPFQDQIVLVTGSSRGLGRAIALAFARENVRGLVVNFKDTNLQLNDLGEVTAIFPTDKILLYRADVTDFEEVQRMFSRVEQYFGKPITTVVNNALAKFSFNGDARPKLEEIKWDQIDSQLRGSLQAAMNTTKAALPGMRQCGFGRIINIGSNLVQHPVVPYHDYTAAKGALVAFTHTCAAELGPSNITVNLVVGGLLRVTDASAATPEAIFEHVARTTPLRTVMTPDDVGDVVLFFASPWARGVTGQSLCVDGGLVMT